MSFVLRCLCVTLLLAGLARCASALDVVEYQRGGEKRTLNARLLVKAADGGLMLEGVDGRIWTIQPEELVKHTTDARPFTPLKPAEAAKQLQAELPAGFTVHATVHYVIVHNTSKAYAQWVGGLLERLYAGFSNYWTKLGFKLKEPEFPLMVLVFDGVENYSTFTKNELQGDARQVVAFYSLQTNRITLYDLTGQQALRRPGDQRGNAQQINAMLSQPEASQMVATIVHEATHQIAYNRGLHRRFADIPLWVAEGLAVFFETPDLSTQRAWATIGATNGSRLDRFREYVPQRPGESLSTLVVDNKRFVQPKQSLDAYAEAWALNHFLLKMKPKEYVGYMQKLADKPPFVWDEPEERMKEFRDAFGDPKELDAELLKHTQRLK
ncbi:MAG: DUF1570 domain-containing protein [Pirellulales bacterium]